MDLHTVHDYDAPAAEVFAMLTDPDFIVAKYTALGQKDVTVLECGQDGDVFRMKNRREVPQELPGFAKRFMPGKNIVVQTEEWGPEENGRRSGRWTLDIQGAPGDIGGSFELAPSGSGSANTIDGKAKAGIPVVGGKLEKFVTDVILKSLAKEHAYEREHLAST